MILLQKESLFSFILVPSYNVSCELLRLHMQFSQYVLENQNIMKMQLVPIIDAACGSLVLILERFVT